MPRTRQTRAVKSVQPHVKVWMERGGEYLFGYGIAEILRAVDESGSTKEAAEALGKSCRYVWGRIKDAETALNDVLVETRVGCSDAQRSNLTPLGKRLMTDFLDLRERVFAMVEAEFRKRFRL
ncbi:MAG: LysR family transcriptional regulator [Planctomycetales bacterium]|nr:LysR family transcriptional regulator [Planctomycetales bacterium]